MSYYFEGTFTVGDLSNGDEFEFMNSNKPWRVIDNDPKMRMVMVRHLNGRGKDSWMRRDRKCFKLKNEPILYKGFSQFF